VAIEFLDQNPEYLCVGFPEHDLRAKKYSSWTFTIRNNKHAICGSKVPLNGFTIINDIKFLHSVDIVENCAMFRTRMFKDNKLGWDERMIIEKEHLDFYLTLKEKHPELKVAMCVNVFYKHDKESLEDKWYQNDRHGKYSKISANVFKQKWGKTEDPKTVWYHNIFNDHPKLLEGVEIYEV